MANKINISPGQLFAVTQGDLFGSNIVCILREQKKCMFLELNDMKNLTINKNDVDTGIQHGVLELLDTLPDDIMSVCIKQYEKNINNR